MPDGSWHYEAVKAYERYIGQLVGNSRARWQLLESSQELKSYSYCMDYIYKGKNFSGL
jgi:hypothetical protein